MFFLLNQIGLFDKLFLSIFTLSAIMNANTYKSGSFEIFFSILLRFSFKVKVGQF